MDDDNNNNWVSYELTQNVMRPLKCLVKSSSLVPVQGPICTLVSLAHTNDYVRRIDRMPPGVCGP